MPRYVLNRKLRSLSGAFDILDEQGAECFRIRGKLLTVGDKLSLLDPDGQEVALIKQQAGLHTLQYEILRSGRLAARVTAAAPVRQRLSVETSDGGVIDVTGDILGMEYRLSRGEYPVATVSARCAPGGGSYAADIADSEDQVLVLAVLVAVEMIHRHEDG